MARGADPKKVDYNRIDEHYIMRDEPHSRMDDYHSKWRRTRNTVLQMMLRGEAREIGATCPGSSQCRGYF